MPVTATDAARALAAQRRKGERICVVCGRPFMGTVRALYDREACHKAAYRARKRGQAEADAESRLSPPAPRRPAPAPALPGQWPEPPPILGPARPSRRRRRPS